ncbi:Gfo/Idh/MocA family protein [Lacrimispora indolis]|uniref:Gfo/Idh/MocA family protein n=1 Tax=Lacrimispora indolis TaxID=69825 RepID=UPI0003F914A6|nr:Gfo/Idh/MocA family oxidoreductase [[Clostridium] methoxybenzovorans]
MKTWRIGVIGCGRISSVYTAAFKNMEEIEVCFAVDKELERAKNFAGRFPGCGFSDRLEDLLEQELDAVHVLTPHYLHKEHAIACLNAGFHVLTEKPIAIHLGDADLMTEAAKRNHKQLGVIFQNRYIEGIREVKRLIEAGEFGRLTGAFSTLNWWRPPSYYDCDWKGSWEREGGGVVIDQAIHSLDLVRYLMGCEPVKVNASIDRRVLTNIEVEDVADAAIVFENGAVYSFFACNYYTSNSPIRVEISGENGTALLTQNEVLIKLKGRPERTVYPAAGPDVQGEAYWGNYHEVQLRDFYRCLEEGRKVPTDPEDAKKTLKLVLDIYRSGKEKNAL